MPSSHFSANNATKGIEELKQRVKGLIENSTNCILYL